MKTKLTITLLFLSFNIFAQVGMHWGAIHNTTGNYDEATTMTADNAGNIYVAGYTYPASGSGNEDIILLKYNSTGVAQWAVLWDGGFGNDRAVRVVADNNGNVYVTGTTWHYQTGVDLIVIKYSSTGTKLWEVRHTTGGFSTDTPYDIIVDETGNLYISGQSTIEKFLFKMNSSGGFLWFKAITAHLQDLYLRNGIIYATGEKSNAGILEMHTVCYNATGDEQWVNNYNFPTSTFQGGKNIFVDASGVIYVTGSGDGSSNGVDIITQKINSSGATSWIKRFDVLGNSTDYTKSIGIDNNNNVYITGISSMGSVTNGVAIKYNNQGDLVWYKTYGYNESGSYTNVFSKGLVDISGNLFITGYYLSNAQNFNINTLKYNSAGDLQWNITYNGTANDTDQAVTSLFDDGKIVITGTSENTGTNFDIVTIKYAELTGIQQTNSRIPDEYSLSQNYPNPFNPVTNIKFSIPKNGNVKLTVFDITGKVIAELVKENLNAGEYKIDFDASGLSSGVYFYKLHAEGFSETRKMILVK